MRLGRTRQGDYGQSWQAERHWYLSQERGSLQPNEPIALEVALGYPNRYPLAMSNLGFQAIYSLLNGLEGVRCERTFLWDTAGSGTLESGRPLRQFPLVGFSMSFELDTLNLLEILRRAHIPLLASQRGQGDPLIMVGGPCAFLNPEPLAPFVDIFIVGEGEEILPALLKVIETSASRDEILETSAQLAGIYIPLFYQVDYHPDGRIQSIRHHPLVPKRVKRQWVSHLNAVQTFSPIITSLSHFKNMCLIEVQRGCGYGCRFCAMGSIYRPLRHRSLNSLRPQIVQAQKQNARIGLVGSAVADLPGLQHLCDKLTTFDKGLGISSLRADRLTLPLAEKLAQLGMKTITIAPEVGSERMRRVINKEVTEENVLYAATLAAQAGIPQLKLYFIVGLPWEREEDIAAVSALVKRVSQVPGLRKIAVSVSAFVPKAATPFQWTPMDKENILRRKIHILAQGLSPLKGVNLAVESPRRSLWQGALAMGDRRVGMVVWHHQEGRLTWARAWRKVGLEQDFFVHRERGLEEILPGDIIDHGLTKAQLWAEYLRAKEMAG